MQQILASRLFSSRRGTALVGLAAAVLAGVVLLVYLNSYRSSVRSSTQPITVLVARNLIEKGTSGNEVAERKLYQATDIAKDQLKAGALTDASALAGRIALTDIYPGQQITAADFTVEPTDSLPIRLTGPDRGISLELDGSHGLTGPLHAGDHVDVWRQIPEAENLGVPLKLLVADVTVLSAPSTPVGGGGTNVVLQLKWWQVPRVADAYDDKMLWLILRPQSGANETKPVTPTSLSLYRATKGG